MKLNDGEKQFDHEQQFNQNQEWKERSYEYNL